MTQDMQMLRWKVHHHNIILISLILPRGRMILTLHMLMHSLKALQPRTTAEDRTPISVRKTTTLGTQTPRWKGLQWRTIQEDRTPPRDKRTMILDTQMPKSREHQPRITLEDRTLTSVKKITIPVMPTLSLKVHLHNIILTSPILPKDRTTLTLHMPTLN